MDCKSDLNSGMTVAKWMDNNAGSVASNFVGMQPIDHVNSRCCDKKRKAIDCPQLVLEYNDGMLWVDLADMLSALYRLPCKVHRWYLKIFWHQVDVAKINGWLGSKKSDIMS